MRNTRSFSAPVAQLDTMQNPCTTEHPRRTSPAWSFKIEAMSAQAAADEAEFDIPEDWEDWRELED